jgi:hypothetical protein
MKKSIVTTLFASLLFYGCGGGSGNSTSTPSSNGSTGKAGSMARFAIEGDYLYTVNRDAMRIFDISEPSHPYPVSKVHVPFDVETLFSYKHYLYVGGESGMYIYDANISTQPTQIGKFTHMRSCDPVVVYDDLAFITLNKGSTCRLNSGENTLQIVDVKDPTHPKLLKTIGMWSPKGLAVDENGTLFVCDGSAGLKLFSVTKHDFNDTNQTRVSLVSLPQEDMDKIDCYDLIAWNRQLVVSNHADVKLFDYTHFPIVELSSIK